jgi:hypothetical protein
MQIVSEVCFTPASAAKCPLAKLPKGENLMLRNFVLSLLLICMGAWCAFTVGCGSSSNSNGSTACTGSYNVVGDWQGTATSGSASDDIAGVINTSGDASFFDNEADIVVLPNITGTCSYSGNLTAYASFENGGGTESGTVSGNVTSDSAITGSETSNGSTTSFTLASYSPISSVTALSGETFGYAMGAPETDTMTLTLSGTSSAITYSGTDAGDCSISGTFTQESTNNVYDVTFNVGGDCTASNLTGIGFESSSDLLSVNEGATGTYAYAIITSGSAPFVLEIVPSSDSPDHRSHQPKAGANFHSLFGFASHLLK